MYSCVVPTWSVSEDPRYQVSTRAQLAIITARAGYLRWYALTELTCGALQRTRRHAGELAPRGPSPYAVRTATRSGLILVRTPPAVRGGVGQPARWTDGEVQADIDLAICPPCKRVVIEQVAPMSRQGFRPCARHRHSGLAPPTVCSWSTTRIADTPFARAFWPGISWPGKLSDPDYCTDMVAPPAVSRIGTHPRRTCYVSFVQQAAVHGIRSTAG